MACPECEKRQARDSKSASDCQQTVKQLEAKSARLTIALTVLSTLVGKELLDEAIGLTDTIMGLAFASDPEPIQIAADIPGGGNNYSNPGNRDRIKPWHSDSSISNVSELLTYVPPLLPSLYEPKDGYLDFYEESYDSSAIVPSSGVLLLGGLAAWKPRGRK